jgi:hypothetical protein
LITLQLQSIFSCGRNIHADGASEFMTPELIFLIAAA